jgi:hypothetical protein
MAFGEILGINTRAYYHLENVNDSGSNGFNLTNTGSIPFNTSKFSNGANFGTAGTGLMLSYGANPLSAIQVSDVVFSFWFKLNSTANHSGFFFVCNTRTADTTGMQIFCDYTIAGGTMTLRATVSTSGTQSVATDSFTADTNWHHLYVRKSDAIKASWVIDRGQNTSGTGTGSLISSISAPTIFLAIGSTRGATLSARAIIDEFFISETLYTGDDPQRDRINHYTQAKGRFCI